jgi:hypoxanthine phosphoribosyltransferase
MNSTDVENDISRILLAPEQINAKIAEVAAQVDKDYAGKDLLLVAVLKGAANTLVDFSMKLHHPISLDFMSISSYGHGSVSSGEITVRQDLSVDVAGKNVLIVEDIIDSGTTLAWLTEYLRGKGAQSVEVFALLSKPERREVEVDVKYLGFEIPNEFVVGFGLDYDEKYRNLDCIAILDPKVYQGDHE